MTTPIDRAALDAAEGENKRLRFALNIGWAKVCLTQSATLCKEPCPWCKARAALQENHDG